jgi:hypothetical protein
LRPVDQQIQGLAGKFPTQPNREFFEFEQGIESRDQGIFSVEEGIRIASLTRIRRMTHKYVAGQVRFSYDNQWLIRALRLRSWRTRRVNRMAGLSGSILTAA